MMAGIQLRSTGHGATAVIDYVALMCAQAYIHQSLSATNLELNSVCCIRIRYMLLNSCLACLCSREQMYRASVVLDFKQRRQSACLAVCIRSNTSTSMQPNDDLVMTGTCVIFWHASGHTGGVVNNDNQDTLLLNWVWIKTRQSVILSPFIVIIVQSCWENCHGQYQIQAFWEFTTVCKLIILLVKIVQLCQLAPSIWLVCRLHKLQLKMAWSCFSADIRMQIHNFLCSEI